MGDEAAACQVEPYIEILRGSALGVEENTTRGT